MGRYKHIAVEGRSRSEHRVVMERKLGRPLAPGEVVHHVDHNPRNNHPDNLVVMTHAQHAAHHNDRHARTKVCEVCGDDYEPAPTKRARSRTCSRPCMVELQSRIATERYREQVSARPKLTCRMCSKEFTVVPRRATTAKFCSQACAAAARRLPL